MAAAHPTHHPSAFYKPRIVHAFNRPQTIDVAGVHSIVVETMYALTTCNMQKNRTVFAWCSFGYMFCSFASFLGTCIGTDENGHLFFLSTFMISLPTGHVTKTITT